MQLHAIIRQQSNYSSRTRFAGRLNSSVEWPLPGISIDGLGSNQEQRFIHYLPFSEAVDVVKLLKIALLPDGKLYISASGLQSELGRNYNGAIALANRFSELWRPMADKHGIHGKVCLYEEKDMRALLKASGMSAEKVYP
jgi:hypothetical protein